MANKHILLVTFPGQGHINPSLQFAKRLAKHGVKVTILTTLYATARMSQTLSPSFHALIDVVSFSTGFDRGWSAEDGHSLMQALSDYGSKAMEDAVAAKRAEGSLYTRIVYNLLMPWAGHVARRVGVPATLLWIQPAILFGVYFHYYNKNFGASDDVIELPGLPRLRRGDLPSFFHDTNPSVYDFVIPLFNENFEMLDEEDYPTVVLNTFDKLEAEALRHLSKYRLLAIGPLIPSAFLDGRDPSDTSFGGDLIQKTDGNYMQYLESAEKESVIYVAFGSYSELPRLQVEAIAEALMRSSRPFLWVIRGSDDETLCCREELDKRGKIVAWCTQVEVLSHPSVGCFVTHCGWNSTLESLASGVPVVALPQWTDQGTNAKLVEDFWRSGVRAVKAGNGEIVEADEIQRCLEMVMDGGDASVEMRKQAKKWRDLAREAVDDGGTSEVNLNIFVDQIVCGRQSSA